MTKNIGVDRLMLPAILLKQVKKQKASFSEDLRVTEIKSPDGYRYTISSQRGHEKGGRFYVTGKVSDGSITGLVSVGAVNGQEVKNGDKTLSENPRISGAGPYVCLKLTPNPITAEVVCNATFGANGENYFHPLALFKKTGKVAQFAYFDYVYKPVYRAGKWIHQITPG